MKGEDIAYFNMIQADIITLRCFHRLQMLKDNRFFTSSYYGYWLNTLCYQYGLNII